MAACRKYAAQLHDNVCRNCAVDEDLHTPCSHYYCPAHIGVCDNCGRADVDHSACQRYTAAAAAAETFADYDDGDISWCAVCGLNEEYHYGDACERFKVSATDHPTPYCAECGSEEKEHDVCEFYRHPSTSTVEPQNGTTSHRCGNCGLQPEIHHLCPCYAPGRNTAEWCGVCGLHEDMHTVCGRFVKGSKVNVCDTCGRNVDHHVWHSFFSKHLSEPHFGYGSVFQQHKSDVYAQFYVDGAAAFAAIADAIAVAQREILIADWILSPEIYLRRGPLSTIADRLDQLLLDRAKAGVQVLVLAWNETKLAFKFANGHAKRTLEALHPNIKVITHPGATGPLNWSHHDKLVCIDRYTAFLGGLDLGFGRYDDPKHTLKDECHLRCTWPGKDYYNPAACMLQNVSRPFEDELDRMTTPRMPWHDAHVRLVGPIARDVSTHFAQRWNHHKDEMDCGPEYPFLLPDMLLGQHSRVWTRSRLASPMGSTEFGELVTEEVPVDMHVTTYSTLDLQQLSRTNSLRDVHPLASDATGHPVSCQLMRSLCPWAGGEFVETSIEQGIIAAIRDAKHYIYIENQYFVSNTRSRVDSLRSNMVKNEVAHALYEKLYDMISREEVFRVMIVLPIYPDGSFHDDVLVRYIMSLQYQTVFLGEDALLTRLAREFPNVDLSRYITFFGLRTWDIMGEAIVTEQVYVHSKLLLVDDVVAVIGSPNLNDRSLIGLRDSEVAAFLRDLSFVPSSMNGAPYSAGSSVYRLRTRLWTEHLGLSDADSSKIRDPIHNDTYMNLLVATAKANTLAYEDVFPTINSNRIRTFAEYEEALLHHPPIGPRNICSQSLNDSATERLAHVRGHLVEWPFRFMSENLSISLVDRGLTNFVHDEVFS